MVKRLSIYSALVLLVCSCINEPQSGANLRVGDSLPEFEVQMSDGTIVSNLTLLGTSALIVFFNTDCPDCQRELPVVEQFYKQSFVKGNAALIPAIQPADNRVDMRYQVVAISRMQSGADVAAYWREQGFMMPFSAQSDRKVYELFAQTRIPRLYAVNSQGIITAMWDDRDMPSVDVLTKAFE
ncbi:MAG: TlpA family protein disulfide reductase [Paludibacteraceae bacterium]|nr:TlpA family protein disulfide reductase [Paludibacteraceae bacterium]